MPWKVPPPVPYPWAQPPVSGTESKLDIECVLLISQVYTGHAWEIISLAQELNFKGKVHSWQLKGWEHLEESISLGFHLPRPQCLFPQRSSFLLFAAQAGDLGMFLSEQHGSRHCPWLSTSVTVASGETLGLVNINCPFFLGILSSLIFSWSCFSLWGGSHYSSLHGEQLLVFSLGSPFL